MKKGLILGAAAMAAVVAAPSADAGEVKMGGYYMFRGISADSNITTETGNAKDIAAMYHRLNIKMDFIASPKTHAHLVFRPLNSNLISSADLGTVTDAIGTASTPGNDWSIRQGWLETEAWGVGVKVGEMPISLNDSILVEHDATAFGTWLLAKSFGDVTAILAGVKAEEGSASSTTASATPANQDDADLYALSLLGKAGSVNWQLTGAYLDADYGSTLGTTINTVATDDVNNFWLALTLNGAMGGIDLTGTIVYEDGFSGVTPTANSVSGTWDANGFLVGLRAKGKTGFGSWSGYAFYGDEDFDSVTNDNTVWSKTWDTGGPGGQDLMGNWAAAATGSAGLLSNATKNMWGIGAGLSVKAGAWTITPHLDYAALAEDRPTGYTTNQDVSDAAWGGSIGAATKIDTDTTFGLFGAYVDPQSGSAVGTTSIDEMHILEATIKMKF
ncbi:hypothetical protein [Magnetofaba australis]|uniref:Porin domain-containing protein n=1 Tax=Magnetofaba australis IT-1 TaxID=1434232 RepID=A0A1Y2K9T3_9PROT|nr:hypothetical protein [Magnetofaba australis]OSM06111.1 hypothetical protein MAIT1_01067 [Magnetofaba australis IT-1]